MIAVKRHSSYTNGELTLSYKVMPDENRTFDRNYKSGMTYPFVDLEDSDDDFGAEKFEELTDLGWLMFPTMERFIAWRDIYKYV